MHTDLFLNHFDLVPANSAQRLENVFRLRHQVYCDELGFEPQTASQLEHDEYDKNSIHCLLLHKASQAYVGCIRLILADGNDPAAPFPFERACGESLHWSFDNSAGTGREQYGEISRLAIIANFRGRRTETNIADGRSETSYAGNEDRRHLFPSISIGLYLAMTAMVLDQGLKGVFAMMEPRLARQLRRFGILFEQVGEPVEHRGTRAPFCISSASVGNDLRPEWLALLGNIQNRLTEHHAQKLEDALV